MDGKLVIAGSFTNIGDAAITGIARLNPDGSRDTNFNIRSGLGSSFAGPAYRQVNALAIQPDGKIVLAGYFETVRGITRYGVARLHPDGSVDQGFEASTRAFYDVENILIQKDGKLVIGNQRFTTNGTRDLTFPSVPPGLGLSGGFMPPLCSQTA